MAGSPADARADCPLCGGEGGVLVARTPRLRVVLAEDPDYPAYVRVIWNAHVAEMSDLGAAERAVLLAAVHAAETALREIVAPHKINLASLGNQVPHVHWHVVARFRYDAHLPQPIWGSRQREPDPARLRLLREKLPALALRITDLLAAPPD